MKHVYGRKCLFGLSPREASLWWARPEQLEQEAEGSHSSPQSGSRESWRWGKAVPKAGPWWVTYFLQRDGSTFSNCVISWEPSVQRPEPMRHASHWNHRRLEPPCPGSDSFSKQLKILLAESGTSGFPCDPSTPLPSRIKESKSL